MAKAPQMQKDSTFMQNVDCHPWNNSHKIEATNSFSDDSIGENSDNSVTSFSSSQLDFEDDASSSSSKPSSPSTYGPLFELSDLMTQLPIKRGLSKYYDGKSQSFTSLGNVGNLEELAKKESCYSKRMKSCRSYGWGLNGRKFGPKATITKKSSSAKGSIFSSKGDSSNFSGRYRRSLMSIDIKDICTN